jgi:chromosome segregation ATPase
MDSYLRREQDRLDQTYKEALEQLMLKDEIINELNLQLDIERTENSGLRKKCNDLEARLMSIEIEDPLPRGRGLQLSNVFEASRLDKMSNHGNNSNADIIKVLEDKAFVEEKLAAVMDELKGLHEKNKNLFEIEELYQQQLEQQKRRIDENFERQNRDKDRYIDELSERYRNLEEDYEQIIINKEVEIKELQANIKILSERNEMLSHQVNQVHHDNNNFTHDYIKEMRQLDERNKELEVELYKKELQYQEEIKKLKRLVDRDISGQNVEASKFSNKSKKDRDSQAKKGLNVEDLAESVSKSIRDKLDSQSKQLSTQNVELIGLQYEVEKLASDLKFEREMKEKLQQTLADVKYRNMSSSANNCVEDAGVQTVIKMNDIDGNKIRLKSVEDSLSKATDNLEQSQKDYKSLGEKNTKLQKELREKEVEIGLLIKKIEKMKSSGNSSSYIDRDLGNMAAVSKLNTTISNLKVKQNELLEKIQYLESGKVPRRPDVGSVSFNLSSEESGRSKEVYNTNKTSYDHENIRLQEDNYFLKEENFKLMSDLSRLNDIVTNLKTNINHLSNEKEDLFSAKNECVAHYEKVIESLTHELDNAKQYTSEKIDEMRDDLTNFNNTNSLLKEQFVSLQNKFYVQTQLLQEKNNEILEEKNISEELNRENMKLTAELNKAKDSVNKLEHEVGGIRSEYEKMIADYHNTRRSLDSLDSASREMEKKEFSFRSENESLKELNNKLKLKLKELYDEIKSKDGRLVDILKEENREIETRLRADINELRVDNENLMKERSMLRLGNNELKHEITMLKEQISHRGGSSGFAPKESKRNAVDPEQFKAVREENYNLKKNIEEGLTKLNQKENLLKTTQLDLDSISAELSGCRNIISQKDREIKSLMEDVCALQDALKKLDNTDKLPKLLEEINSKNKTINYLIEEVDACKKDFKEMKNQNEIIMIKLKDENEDMILRLKGVTEQFDRYKHDAEGTIEDLRKENDILINDLDDKDKAFENILMDKNNLEHNFEKQNKNNEDVYEKISTNYQATVDENNALKNRLEEVTNESIDKFNRLNEKFIKSKTKIDTLANIYEAYIKYLKERFQMYIEEINLFMGNLNNADKLTRIIKNFENLTDLTAKISEREAMIDNFKAEIKGLKVGFNKSTETVKRLTKENDEMNEVINTKKLQGRYKKMSANRVEMINKLIDYENITRQLSEMKLKEGNSKVKLQTANAEINLLNEKLKHSKEKLDNNDEIIKKLQEEIAKRDKDSVDLNKTHKGEVLRMMDELKRIKDKWISPEKQQEKDKCIEEQEKYIKNLKDDINRKKELINTLKSQLTEVKETTTSVMNNTAKDGSAAAELNEKVKSLNKDLSRKDVLIKELKAGMESLKDNDKKYNDEIAQLQEKLKISKIDISRKEGIIKELKDKIKEQQTQMEASKDSKIEDLNYNIKKLKTDLERKDTIIKSLKAKLETSDMEIEQLKEMNNKLNRANTSEIDKEIKHHDSTKRRLDMLSTTNENLLTVVRRVFKDLVSTFEKLKSKTNIYVNTQSYKEGMDILGVSQDELHEYLNPSEKVDMFDRLNSLLEKEIIEPETFLDIYHTLKDKIFGFEKILKNLSELDTTNTPTRDYRPDDYYKANNPMIKKYESYLLNNKSDTQSGNLNSISRTKNTSFNSMLK